MTRSPPLTVITGASRGLGEALALQALERGHRVLGLARGASDLLRAAASDGGAVAQWACDLSDPVPIARRLKDWLIAPAQRHAEGFLLINNAALLTEPGPLSANDLDELSMAMRVCLEATLVLTAAFLDATEGTGVPRRVCSISSGLGRRAMAGGASYCAAKAGIDHFTRALALEEAEKPDGARVVALAPGVIDTPMQRQLRGADPRRFPSQAMFAGLHSQGALSSAGDAAAAVWRFLDRPDFGSDPIGDVRG